MARITPMQSQIRSATSGRMGRGASAEIAIQFEMREFERALQRYVEAYPRNIVGAVKTLAFKLEGKVKRRTPVDTGRARSSIHTVVPGVMQDSFAYTASTEGKVAQRAGRKAAKARGEKYAAPTGSFDGSLGTGTADPATGIIEAIVGSNVEYLPALEGGHSRQRPEGMFRVSIAEMRGELEKSIARAEPGNVKA